MADRPVGHVLDYGNDHTPATVAFLVEGLRLNNGADKEMLLSDLSFIVNAYKLDAIADKTRHAGILEALRESDRAFQHTWAAHQWIKLHGGKKQDPHKSRIKYRSIKTRPKLWAKHALATSLAQLLIKFTDEAVNTSRETDGSGTNNGTFATLYQGVLRLVDGEHGYLADPFPYLAPVVKSL